MILTNHSSPGQGYFSWPLIACTILLVLMTTSCKKKNEVTWRILEDGITGTWILKDAVFRNPIDLDGPGLMQPTRDAKTLLYDLLDVYKNCSSVNEISFRFTDEPPREFKDNFWFPFANACFAVCPQGFGITEWLCDYQFYDKWDGKEYDIPAQVVVLKYDINDPADLILTENLTLYLIITGEDTTDGKYSISGHSGEDSMKSNYPDNNPDMIFDWVMERVDTD